MVLPLQGNKPSCTTYCYRYFAPTGQQATTYFFAVATSALLLIDLGANLLIDLGVPPLHLWRGDGGEGEPRWQSKDQGDR